MVHFPAGTHLLAKHDFAGEESVMCYEDVWTLIRKAYVFSLPLVLMDNTRLISTNVAEPGEGQAPINQMSHARSLTDASFKQVVTPNVDTLYSQVFFDLSEDALVIHKPAAERFLNFQVMDAWSDTVAVLGTGTDTQDEATYLLTGPAFDDEVPDGMVRVEVPTAIGWIIARTVCNGPDDLESVYALQSQMDARPLGIWQSGGDLPIGTYDARLQGVPVKMTLGAGPKEHFDHFNSLLLKNPAYPEDAELLASLATVGIGPGLSFDASILGPDAMERWRNMLGTLAPSLTKSCSRFFMHNGVFASMGKPIGDFGSEYDYRGMVALMGFGANPVDIAAYMQAECDQTGEALDGHNSYAMHFEPGELPPVKANGFWSVTAYGEDSFLIDNPLDRYAINDRSGYDLNEDGSMDILLQAEQPEEHTNNWLPVKKEGFHLFLRVYLPADSIQDGTWHAPTIKRT